MYILNIRKLVFCSFFLFFCQEKIKSYCKILFYVIGGMQNHISIQII